MTSDRKRVKGIGGDAGSSGKEFRTGTEVRGICRMQEPGDGIFTENDV